jgi:hypothetical protein
VLVADALNAQMRSRDIAGVLAVADAVGQILESIDDDVRFWHLPNAAVAAQPEEGDVPAWPIWRAWTILTSVHGVNRAGAHKILHHKRPSVFPLLDNMTAPRLCPACWAAVHRDLNATSEAWSRLEDETGGVLEHHGGVRLTRLRLHDIILWCRATGSDERAKEYGRMVLAAHGSGPGHWLGASTRRVYIGVG